MGHFLPNPGSPALAQADRQKLSCSTAPPDSKLGACLPSEGAKVREVQGPLWVSRKIPLPWFQL